jgi:hypothetical protein
MTSPQRLIVCAVQYSAVHVHHNLWCMFAWPLLHCLRLMPGPGLLPIGCLNDLYEALGKCDMYHSSWQEVLQYIPAEQRPPLSDIAQELSGAKSALDKLKACFVQ